MDYLGEFPKSGVHSLGSIDKVIAGMPDAEIEKYLLGELDNAKGLTAVEIAARLIELHANTGKMAEAKDMAYNAWVSADEAYAKSNNPLDLEAAIRFGKLYHSKRFVGASAKSGENVAVNPAGKKPNGGNGSVKDNVYAALARGDAKGAKGFLIEFLGEDSGLHAQIDTSGGLIAELGHVYELLGDERAAINTYEIAFAAAHSSGYNHRMADRIMSRLNSLLPPDGPAPETKMALPKPRQSGPIGSKPPAKPAPVPATPEQRDPSARTVLPNIVPYRGPIVMIDTPAKEPKELTLYDPSAPNAKKDLFTGSYSTMKLERLAARKEGPAGEPVRVEVTENILPDGRVMIKNPVIHKQPVDSYTLLDKAYKKAYGLTNAEVIERYNAIISRDPKMEVEDAFKMAADISEKAYKDALNSTRGKAA